MTTRLVLALGMAAFIWSAAPASAQGVSPEVTKCRATKTKCACKKTCARFKAIIGFEKNGDVAKFAGSNAKLESQYTSCMSKADAKGGCPIGADTATLEAKVDAFVASYSAEIG